MGEGKLERAFFFLSFFFWVFVLRFSFIRLFVVVGDGSGGQKEQSPKFKYL